MSNVSNETNATETMYNFFSLSQIGGLGGLMYHNLTMATGNATTAKAAIYDPFTTGASGTNLKLSNWYNYDQTPFMVFDIFITNTSADYDVAMDIFIYDPASTTQRPVNGNPFNIARNNGSNVSLPDHNTGVTADTTNFANGYYEIWFSIQVSYFGVVIPEPGLGSINGNILTASDTDGAGPPGTTRTAVTIPTLFQGGGTYTFQPAIYGNISGNNIYVNKRTTFNLTFQD